MTSADSPQIRSDKLRYAAELVAQLEEGGSITETRARALAERRFALDGTNFGWRKLDQLPSLFANAVEPMSVGQIEGPIEAGNGFHIIQLRDKRGGTEQIVKQTHIRHIMLAPNEIRDEQQTIALINELSGALSMMAKSSRRWQGRIPTTPLQWWPAGIWTGFLKVACPLKWNRLSIR